MAIVLDPNRSFVNILIYYIEEKKKAGNSVFHFIDNPEMMDDWRRKGYKTKEEYLQEAQAIHQFSADPAALAKNLAQGPRVAAIPDDKLIEALNTTWKRPTWKEQNITFAQSLRPIGGEMEIDPLKYRELKLKTSLKKWDAKDDDGNPIPLTPDNMDNLCPEFAAYLLKAFERVTEPTDDDLKN